MNLRDGAPRPLRSTHPLSPVRLGSWKEIAGYLDRDVRTVRRWEKTEGLPIHRLQHGKSATVFAITAELDAWMAHRTDVAARPPIARPAARGRWIVAAAMLVLLAASAIRLASKKLQPAPAPTETDLTTDPAAELEPRLSPDGARVLYVADLEKPNSFDIYARTMRDGTTIRVTHNAADDYSPVWSPDGALIAFLRQESPTSSAVFIAPSSGGFERRITSLSTVNWPDWSRPGGFLAWSPNPKWLIATGRVGSEHSDRLLRIDVGTGEIVALTSPPGGSPGDCGPAISPDGSQVAFARRWSWGVSELYVARLAPDMTIDGAIRKLDTGFRWNASPAWLPSGEEIVFSGGRLDAPRLARIAVSKLNRAKPFPAIGNYGWQPSVAALPGGAVRLVYTRHFESVNIWSQALFGRSPPERLIASAHWSYEPDYSPDGSHIAFLSDRSGDVEVWVTDSDGKNPQQWTFLSEAGLGAPRWLPGGSRIAFSVPSPSGSSIYILNGPREKPRLVRGSEKSGYFACSPDGRSIYFSSRRGGSTQIWRVPVEGGEAVQVTAAGGRAPAVSPDGKWLYYLRMLTAAGEQSLFRVPVSGGKEERVLEFVDAYSVATAAIAYKYYRPGPEPDGPRLRLFRFAAEALELLPKPPKPLRYGVAISPDGGRLLYSQADYEVNDLVLVEGI